MSQEIRAEMSASVWKLVAAVGDTIDADGEIMILESMKMEIPVEAEHSGRITEIHVAEGDSVVEGQLLATLE